MVKNRLLYRWFFLVPMLGAWAQQPDIDQNRGVDQRVNYRSLTDFGPWDDRNYQLTLEDLSLLSLNEREQKEPIPAFYRVELRRRIPHLPRIGPAQYPRSAAEKFRLAYGGLMRNGQIPIIPALPVPVGSEITLNQLLGAREASVEINPANPMQVIAGANTDSGQEMYYSSDGGATWNTAGVLPGSCCDPTIGWSSSGTIAYTASLTTAATTDGVSFWRSFNGGQTWGPTLVISDDAAADKEFVHVDLSPNSPYRDQVYMTFHIGGVMQFAYSNDLGVSFMDRAFPTAPMGIGSDITTDDSGNIFYVYGAYLNKEIILLKSSDGGANFETPRVIAHTQASYSWPIPAMETRFAWIYATADADRSGGTFHNSIYVAWTDTTNVETASPITNHSRIQVAASRDGGDTWSISSPHSSQDTLTVDRFNQWLSVDNNGVVHVVFYDTRHSSDRSGTDLYYSFSLDGAQTWSDPARISSQTSPNIQNNVEWGDYNGLSVNMDKMISAWTDNRGGPPDMRNALVAEVDNVTHSPTFLLGADPLALPVCAGTGEVSIDLELLSLQNFTNLVTLNFVDLPPGFTASFGANQVVPPGATTATLEVAGSVAPGVYSFQISASATASDNRQITVEATVLNGAYAAPSLISPQEGTPAGYGQVQLAWENVDPFAGYQVQLADNPDFTAPVFETDTSETVVRASGIEQGSTYYWRVRSTNPCAEGPYSNTGSFLATRDARILLVDHDDNTPNVASYFIDTLNAMGLAYVSYDVFAENKTPDFGQINPFSAVIWFTGDQFDYGPTAEDGLNLATYLDNGGKLFLSSQDYLYLFRPNTPPFAANYLGLGPATNESGNYTSVEPVAGGIFDELGSMELVYPIANFSDSLSAGSGSLALVGNNGKGAAVTTDDTVFFGFSFTAIAGNPSLATSQNARDVLAAVFDHFQLSCLGSDLSVDAGEDADACSSGYVLNPSVNGGTEPLVYSWSPANLVDDPSSPTPTAMITETSLLVLSVSDGAGCVLTDTVRLHYLQSLDDTNLADWTLPLANDTNGNGTLDVADLTAFLNNQTGCGIGDLQVIPNPFSR